MHILVVIHLTYAILGVIFNFLLISTIFKTKSSGLKGYAVLIFNVAIVDVVEIAVDAFEVPRLVPYGEHFILIFDGKCGAFGHEFCYRCHLLMLHLLFHSLFLIAYSFWYRYKILLKPAPPRWTAIQLTVAIVFVPNAVPMMLSWLARDDRQRSEEVLQNIYPTMDLNTTTHRSVNVFDYFSTPTDFTAMIVPFGVYTFIIVVRRKLLRKLDALSGCMSATTKQLHESLAKALTYHAILPSTICLGVISFYFQLIGIHNSVIDSLMFIFSCIPAILNPLLTLYFVAPYRRSLLRAIGREPVNIVKFSSTSTISITITRHESTSN